MKPDGVSQKGLPKDRPDLLTFETLLKRQLKIRYLPLEFARLVETWAKELHNADNDISKVENDK